MRRELLRICTLTDKFAKYQLAAALQENLVQQRRLGNIPDTLLIVQVCYVSRDRLLLH
jgi:hypothetical protein